MKLVLLGGPGAGKGTQSKILAKHYDVAHISTGDLLREEMKNKTQIGLDIQELMDDGNLVADQLMIEILKAKIETCRHGFVLDGFPRTLVQAEILEEVIGEVDKIILMDVPDGYVIKRMSGRYTCPNCGAMYHIEYNPPKIENTCDVCSTQLIQREDDKARTVQNRLKVFHELTSPIIDYFRSKNMLIEIDGTKDIAEVTNTLIKELEG